MTDATSARPAPPPLILLVALSAIQPMALNIIAPSTPAMARQFGTDYGTVQLTLTVYLFAVAASQLVTGPWSDRVGRRPVILAALGVFLVGCVAAAIAPNIETLIASRIVQAIGSGTAFAMARAIIRDTSHRDEAASRIGYMMVAMLIIPMLSPSVGSIIDRFAGWQAIFLLMALVGAVIWPLVHRSLPETNVNRDEAASFAKLAGAFPTLLSNRSFIAYTLSVCATSGMFFSFVAGAPFVVVESMGNEPYVYALWFVFLSFGYAIGNFVSGRYASRFGSEKLIHAGTWIALGATLLQTTWTLVGAWSPAVLFVPGFLIALGNGISIPGATASALSVRPDLAGAASGLAGAMQLGVAGVMATIAGHVVTTSPKGLIALMFACAVLGVLALALPRDQPKS